jgi:hypothetical protein
VTASNPPTDFGELDRGRLGVFQFVIPTRVGDASGNLREGLISDVSRALSKMCCEFPKPWKVDLELGILKLIDGFRQANDELVDGIAPGRIVFQGRKDRRGFHLGHAGIIGRSGMSLNHRSRLRSIIAAPPPRFPLPEGQAISMRFG